MELNTANNNSRVIYSIAYKITKYHYSFIFTFLVKETTQANKEYDIFGPFWVRFGKFTDPPPYLNPCQYKCCSRLRDNVYFEIKVLSLEFVKRPPPQQYFPTHRLRFKNPSQTLEKSSNLLKCLNKCIFRVINKDSSGPLHAHCCRCNLNRKKVIPASNMNTTT